MLPDTLAEGPSSDAIGALYGADPDVRLAQSERHLRLMQWFIERFGHGPDYVYSSPGRCELGGNHTDHNGGRVLATSITMDVLGAFSRAAEPLLTVYSAGFAEPFVVDLRDVEPRASEHPTTQLLRGIASGFKSRGKHIEGLNVALDSAVLFASGLSSSAALEVLFATVFNDLFNDSEMSTLELSIIGQEAEHRFWGKPVGLLDQITIGTGGLLQISFKDPRRPEIERIPFNFQERGYQLALINPGGDHSLLTSEYKAIAEEMGEVARHFNCSRLIDTDWSQVMITIAELRKTVGDRAILRALHFYEENIRVEGQARALKRGDIHSFLELVRASGSSSWRLLQNCYQPSLPRVQPLSLALAITETLSRQWESEFAYRIHGGGFGGTILVMIPQHLLGAYREKMDAAFGFSTVQLIQIREMGCVNVGRLNNPQVTIAPYTGI